MSLFKYYTNFRLRVKDTTGTVLATFVPATNIGRQIELASIEPVEIEREKIDYSTDHYFLGYKQIVKATFIDTTSDTISAYSGYSTLETVLETRQAGYVFEYSLNALGTVWIPCELVRYTRKKLGKKNVGVEVSIELISKGLVSNPL